MQELLKTASALLLFPISFYLGWKKLGVGVSFTYTIGMSAEFGTRIRKVTLINNKDKTLPISRITAVYDGVLIELNAFDAPLLIKAHEGITVESEPYSHLILYKNEYKIVPRAEADISLFVEVNGDNYPCKPLFKKRFLPRRRIRAKHMPHRYTYEHNGKIYDPLRTRFIAEYIRENQVCTSFILDSGIITDSEDLGCNFIPKHKLLSCNTVQNYLRDRNPTVEITESERVYFQPR